MTTTQASTKLEIAESLAGRGFYPFRIKSSSKKPFAFGWQAEAVSCHAKPASVDWGLVNFGIFTEHFGDNNQALIVVDIDVKDDKNGEFSLDDLAMAGYTLPPTFEVRTPGGGRHVYYHHDHAFSSGVDVLGPGLDIRSDGGYVLAPGSVIAGSGEYKILFDLPIAPLPEWLATRLTLASRKEFLTELPPEGVELSSDSSIARATAYLKEAAPEAIQGAGGNTITYQVALRLRDFGIERLDALALMDENWNYTKATPPWHLDELAEVVDHAYQYAKEQIGNRSPQADFDVAPEITAEDEAHMAVKPSRFMAKMFRADAAKAITSSNYLVDHLLMQRSFSMLVGESNVGKTFIALDLAYHVVCGQPWRGYKTRPASVLYIATEGTGGIENRVVGVQKKYPDFKMGPEYLYTIPQGVDFFNNDKDLIELKKAIAQIKEHDGATIGMVIIDTLSRVLAGGNENAPDDIGRVIKRADALREEMDVHVMLVHHKGKDAAKGARGHSKLFCDIDTHIDIVATSEDTGLICLPKQKDDVKVSALGFRRVILEIGKREEDGEAVTTCAIEEFSVPVTAAKDFMDTGPKLSTNQKLTLQAIHIAMDDHGVALDGDTELPSFSINGRIWRDAFVAMYGGDAHSARTIFARAKNDLLEKRVVRCIGNDAWVLNNNE